MGIPKERFVDRQHEQFICTICGDVSVYPVVTNDCDHIFCGGCMKEKLSVDNGSDNQLCPSCKSKLEDPKFKPIRGSIKWIYLDLVIKCLNPICNHKSNPDTFAKHDDTCKATFEICNECGHKGKIGDEHSCTSFLKDRMIELEKHLNQVRKAHLSSVSSFQVRIKALETVVKDVNPMMERIKMLEAMVENQNSVEERIKIVEGAVKYVIPMKDNIKVLEAVVKDINPMKESIKGLDVICKDVKAVFDPVREEMLRFHGHFENVYSILVVLMTKCNTSEEEIARLMNTKIRRCRYFANVVCSCKLAVCSQCLEEGSHKTCDKSGRFEIQTPEVRIACQCGDSLNKWQREGELDPIVNFCKSHPECYAAQNILPFTITLLKNHE